jgi:hypothetical protein
VWQGFGGIPNPCSVFSIFGKFVVEAKCSIDSFLSAYSSGQHPLYSIKERKKIYS